MTAIDGFRLPRVIDSTMLNGARECLQKFNFEYGFGYASPNKAVDLIAGGAIAAGRHALYKASYGSGMNRMDALGIAKIAFDKEWGDFVLPEGSKSPKTKVRTWEALIDYANTFDPPNDKFAPAIHLVDDPFEWPFSVPLTKEFTGTAEEWPLHPSGEPFMYSGRLDEIATAAAGSMVFGLDDKTTSRFAQIDTWVAGLSMRAQMIGYNFILRKLIDPKCDSFVVRQGAIRSTGVEWRESPLIPISRHMIDRWLLTTRKTLLKILDANEKNEWEPALGDVCVSWSRPCSFLDACRARDPQRHLEGFVVRRWSPLDGTEMED